MLTEEAIKQTRFFRRVDEKLYMVRSIEHVKLVTLILCENGVESQLHLGDPVCSEFAPVQICTVRRRKAAAESSSNQVVAPGPSRVKPRKQKESSGSADKTRGRGNNKFKGVKKEKHRYKDGRDKYSASYRNPETKKNEYLGTFDNEFLAAAAWFERDGNKAEAARLRDLVKEAEELNPDKPLDGAAKHELKRTGKTIWICKRCGLEYQSKGTCPGCGNDDMREVPA
jgi:rubrerythrin